LRQEAERTISATGLVAICELTHDLPALWRAQTSARAERLTIVRLLIERVLVEVVSIRSKSSAGRAYLADRRKPLRRRSGPPASKPTC
jgi:hypothetical protein